MTNSRHQHCRVKDVRLEVERRLTLPPCAGRTETPRAFWDRVEKAGKLAEALALFDRLTAEQRSWSQMPRETKTAFWARVEQEGRQADAEGALQELLASGVTLRDAQFALVERFQPLDGNETRAWETPDPWQRGRLFRRKCDQDALVALADYVDEEQARYDEAADRVAWARLRREEGLALAAARWRLREFRVPAESSIASA